MVDKKNVVFEILRVGSVATQTEKVILNEKNEVVDLLDVVVENNSLLKELKKGLL